MTVKAKAKTTSDPDHIIPKFKAPQLGPNTTPEMLVDELGLAKEHLKYWETAEAFYKEALKGRTAKDRSKPKNPTTRFEGDQFYAQFEQRQRNSLDTTAIRNMMGDEWCKQFERNTEYEQITVKRV